MEEDPEQDGSDQEPQAGRDGEEDARESGSGAGKPQRRRWIAFALLAAIAGLAWETMDPGKLRSLVVLLVAFFAFRVAISASR